MGNTSTDARLGNKPLTPPPKAKQGARRHNRTDNPWWGCQRVGQGCGNCYAAALDNRPCGNFFQQGKQPKTRPDRYW
ncbi:DUF5131 family protein [Thiothrix sp.]|uniref:DUF5131 family protein n=1 Tax=Thiothrix sp. TaxID=1032 RepID=UPI00342F9F64